MVASARNGGSVAQATWNISVCLTAIIRASEVLHASLVNGMQS